jgi:MFS family permease
MASQPWRSSRWSTYQEPTSSDCGAVRYAEKMLSGLYLVRTVAMALFVLLPLTTWNLYAFAAVTGVFFLGTVPLSNGLIAQIFGVRYITTLFGFLFFGHQLGLFFGVWLGGYIFEATGSYQGGWLVAIAVGMVAALVHLPIDDRAIVRAGVKREVVA